MAQVMRVSEQYPRLYHYTTSTGVLGIIQQKCLWATHYKFLNDYSEIKRFRPKLIELLLPIVLDQYNNAIQKFPNSTDIISANGGLDTIVKHDTEVFVDSSYDALGDEIYITSFCGEHSDDYINNNGLLSQWRAYGGCGGYAIIFRTQELEEMIQLEFNGFHYDFANLADVVYSDEEEKIKLEFSPHLNNIAKHSIAIFETILRQENESPDATESYPSFASCISRYKDRGFKEEQEIRIVALPTTITAFSISIDYFI